MTKLSTEGLFVATMGVIAITTIVLVIYGTDHTSCLQKIAKQYCSDKHLEFESSHIDDSGFECINRSRNHLEVDEFYFTQAERDQCGVV